MTAKSFLLLPGGTAGGEQPVICFKYLNFLLAVNFRRKVGEKTNTNTAHFYASSQKILIFKASFHSLTCITFVFFFVLLNSTEFKTTRKWPPDITHHPKTALVRGEFQSTLTKVIRIINCILLGFRCNKETKTRKNDADTQGRNRILLSYPAMGALQTHSIS